MEYGVEIFLLVITLAVALLTWAPGDGRGYWPISLQPIGKGLGWGWGGRGGDIDHMIIVGLKLKVRLAICLVKKDTA